MITMQCVLSAHWPHCVKRGPCVNLEHSHYLRYCSVRTSAPSPGCEPCPRRVQMSNSWAETPPGPKTKHPPRPQVWIRTKSLRSSHFASVSNWPHPCPHSPSHRPAPHFQRKSCCFLDRRCYFRFRHWEKGQPRVKHFEKTLSGGKVFADRSTRPSGDNLCYFPLTVTVLWMNFLRSRLIPQRCASRPRRRSVWRPVTPP